MILTQRLNSLIDTHGLKNYISLIICFLKIDGSKVFPAVKVSFKKDIIIDYIKFTEVDEQYNSLIGKLLELEKAIRKVLNEECDLKKGISPCEYIYYQIVMNRIDTHHTFYAAKVVEDEIDKAYFSNDNTKPAWIYMKKFRVKESLDKLAKYILRLSLEYIYGEENGDTEHK